MQKPYTSCVGQARRDQHRNEARKGEKTYLRLALFPFPCFCRQESGLDVGYNTALRYDDVAEKFG